LVQLDDGQRDNKRPGIVNVALGCIPMVSRDWNTAPVARHL